LDVSVDTWNFFYTSLVSLWLQRFYIYFGVAFGLSIWFIIIHFSTKRKKKVTEEKSNGNPTALEGTEDKLVNGYANLKAKEVYVAGTKIFYGSQTGTAKRFAKGLAEAVTLLDLPVEVISMGDYDPEDCLSEETSSRNICVFLVATYTDGQPTESAAWFCKWLEEAASDFRYGKTYLKGLRYAVFGLGNSVYVDHYNTVGRKVDRWLWMLGASRIMTRAEGDCNVAQSKHGSIEADFEAWKTKFLSRLQALCRGEKKPCSGKCKKGKCKSRGKQSKESSDQERGASEPENAEAEELFESSSEEEADAEEAGGTNSVVDVEDLGNIVSHMKKTKVQFKKFKAENCQYTQGAGFTALVWLSLVCFNVFGVSVCVFLCCQAMLRGRGGCYKHTFYGIQSHRCMEATPSLACANKCVFCWRHHTNPVGTEWQWKMDQPEMILQEAIENHQNMIKQFKGVSGVKAARLEEAMTVKHCALSLVGEPIMYPQINQFVKLLHQHGISSFLVTNAQFPDEIRNLEPVTQLYVSVDASTKESLKRIDRPLFKDFWQRFLDSLKALSEK
ncbi:TYW1 synthase, partial [Indicator maculatus]|nr:TYW1 synthase [Indicator maculatus]